MKFIRHFMTLLALGSVTAALAGENRWFAGKYRPAPAVSYSETPTIDGGNRWFAGKYRTAGASSALQNDVKACKDKQSVDPKKP